MRNKIIGISIFISIIMILVIVLIKQVPKTIELTTFEKAYNIVQLSDEETIEIPLYINYLDSYLVKKENLANANINNNEDSLSFTLEDITAIDDVTYLKNKKFYKYIFKLKPNINLDTDFTLEMENSYLELNYEQGVNVKIGIGSFCYYYYKTEASALAVKQLKGLINTYEDKTLVGVLIGLKNSSSTEIKIKKIIPLDLNVNASLDEIVLNKEFNQGVEIDDLLGYQYNPLGSGTTEDIEIVVKDETSLFIPLKYIKNVLLNKIGFLIEYEENGVIQHLCIDDFIFFDTTLYSVKRINNLKYYTYENY